MLIAENLRKYFPIRAGLLNRKVAEVKAGRAELMVASVTEPDMGAKPMALDALVPIVAPDNPLPGISTLDLAKVLAGEIKNWKDIGGPDMPLVLHGLTPDSDLARALSARLGRDSAATETHADLHSLAEAVAKEYNVSREAQDEFSFHSHQKAINAIKEGYFKSGIIIFTKSLFSEFK